MLIKTTVKEDEKRVFFEFAGRQPREGEPRERLDLDQEKAEALLERVKWEKKNRLRLLNFHYDPYAGGLEPREQPKGQVVRSGKVIDAMNNVTIIRGNLSEQPDGATEMRPIGAWTGEWI